MRIKVFLSLLSLLVLIGCASKPPTADLFANLNSTATPDTLISAMSVSALEAKLNTTTPVELDSNSRVLSFDGYRSFYKAVEVKSDGSGSFNLQIESICACFGFDKRIAVPVVLAVDAAGSELPITEVKYTSKRASGVTPFRVVMQGKVVGQKDAMVRILLLSDNSSIDQPVQKIRLLNQYGVKLMSLEVLSYPIGKYVLTLSSAD
jgi:hypothetical protein